MPVSSATSADSRRSPSWSRAGCQTCSGRARIARRTGSVTACPTEKKVRIPRARRARTWARKSCADPALSVRTRMSVPCRWASGICVTAGAVPADHLHLGVVAEPAGQGLTLATVVKVQRPVGSHVDQQGAVMPALAESEVIDAQHLHFADGRLRHGSDHAQQRVPAHRDADGGRHAGSRPAREGQADLRQHPPQWRGVATVRGVNPAICSANVTAGHLSFSQRKRRTPNSITTPRPPAATSRSCVCTGRGPAPSFHHTGRPRSSPAPAS